MASTVVRNGPRPFKKGKPASPPSRCKNIILLIVLRKYSLKTLEALQIQARHKNGQLLLFRNKRVSKIQTHKPRVMKMKRMIARNYCHALNTCQIKGNTLFLVKKPRVS